MPLSMTPTHAPRPAGDPRCPPAARHMRDDGSFMQHLAVSEAAGTVSIITIVIIVIIAIIVITIMIYDII